MKGIGKTIMIAAAMLAGVRAFAQGGADALPFVRCDFGPVLIGSAGAAVASTDTGAWGVFGKGQALAFGHGAVNAGAEFRANGEGNGGVSAAVAGKLPGRLGAGIGISYLGGDDIGGYKTSDVLLTGVVAYGITEKFSVGVNMRYAKQNLTESVSYSGVSMDFGAMAKLTDGLSATVGLAAIGGKVKGASGEEYSLPGNAYAGMEYVLDLDSYKLALDAMGEYYLSGNYGVSAGAAFTYADMITVRTGYRFASEWCVLPSHFAAGLEGKIGSFSLNLGAAKMPATFIVYTGIGFSF